MQKRWVKTVIAVAALFIVVFGLIPFFINADTFRPKIETELSSSLGRKVTMGHLSFSLITGSLVADNLSVADDPSLSSTPFLEAKELRLGIALGQFLFHHSVQITDLTVDSPSIHLIQEQNGTWNFSSMGSASAKPAPQQESVLPALTVDSVKIKNGSATVSSIPAAGKPFVCSEINLTVQHFSFAQSFPFELSIKVPGDGSLKLSGKAGPISQKDAADTPFQATLEIKHFDPVAANAVALEDGISMVADFDAQISSDGSSLTSTGKIVASKLQLARNGSPAPRPVNIDYTISDNLEARKGQVSDIAIHTGSVEVHVNGGFQVEGQSVVLDLHLAAPNLPVDQLEQLLPAVGVSLPSGSKLVGGTLTANLAITGPANALTIAGPVEIGNTQLSGFDLGSKIQGVNPISGTSNGTEIQKLSADVNNSPQGTRFSNIDAEIPKIGTATGEGAVSPSGELNFQLNAKIAALSAVGGVVDNGANAISGLFGKNSKPASKSDSGGIPLSVTGTASNPSIHVQMGKMLKNAASGVGSTAQKPVKSLKGIFGK